MKTIRASIFYVLNRISIYLNSIYYNAILRLIWKIEGFTIFEGPVYTNSIKGSITIGKKVRIGPNVRIDCSKAATLFIGNNCSVNAGTHIICKIKITIEDDCRIGEFCSIRDNDHKISANEKISENGFVCKPTILEKNVWVGRGVHIGKGIRIGTNSVIGANSVVTKSVNTGQIWAGVPAKKLNQVS